MEFSNPLFGRLKFKILGLGPTKSRFSKQNPRKTNLELRTGPRPRPISII